MAVKQVRILLLLVFVPLLAGPLQAQELVPVTGDLTVDLRGPGSPERWFSDTVLSRPEKSPLIAGGLSVLVPGAGQIYSEAPLWRALLYGLVEGAGWTFYAIKSRQGKRATTGFEEYANAHWSVVRYVGWIEANLERWTPDEIDADAARDALRQIYTAGDPGRPAWERINRIQLNRLERAVTGGFSHTLPEQGDQQYYEQIGKYAQYRAGWDDHQPAGDTLVYDPSRTTANNRAYMDRRAEANDYLGAAVAAGGVLVLNHLASMLDALLSARSYNIALRAGLRGGILPDESYDPAIGPGPQLEITVRF